ncbi:putative Golgi matrix protein [Terfezia boudieri ATCC MYA-4762]|uniref:Putative Golgi matrix protein n=1 Tax=Terfezia boudieri ATCC MYA-4762 TaxID=1051890 RepID=A0A3N4M6Q7_9PEZI|nr:putative Golgi matrix protein [Terfezia boudieri ATCC MYA-4762]
MKELLVKQQEKTKELEERLKKVIQDWSKEKNELQKELEGAKEAHQKDLAEGDKRQAKMEDEKRQLSEQYKNLLNKVSTLKERMAKKLEADADALAEARSTAAELEKQNMLHTNQLDELRTEYRKLNEESTDVIREVANLRNRLNLSQQNWVKEREQLISQENHLQEEYATTRQAMQDWEVIAMEERSMRELLADRVVELEEQLTAFKTGYEKAISERDRENATIDGLQRALREIQEARKIELREITENMQGSIDHLMEKSQKMEQRAIEAEAQLLKSQDDLERFQQFEKEVKEKNLLIGKLRHEAVTLNDHLTKALRMLKKGNASDNVDKQLVSNVFLSFLSIQRGDAKKFEVLQLIASVLDWNDEQRERAGLARPGTSSSQSTLPTPQGSFSRASSPLIPYHRTPSTPTLSDPYEGNREVRSPQSQSSP